MFRKKAAKTAAKNIVPQFNLILGDEELVFDSSSKKDKIQLAHKMVNQVIGKISISGEKFETPENIELKLEYITEPSPHYSLVLMLGHLKNSDELGAAQKLHTFIPGNVIDETLINVTIKFLDSEHETTHSIEEINQKIEQQNKEKERRESFSAKLESLGSMLQTIQKNLNLSIERKDFFETSGDIVDASSPHAGDKTNNSATPLDTLLQHKESLTTSINELKQISGSKKSSNKSPEKSTQTNIKKSFSPEWKITDSQDAKNELMEQQVIVQKELKKPIFIDNPSTKEECSQSVIKENISRTHPLSSQLPLNDDNSKKYFFDHLAEEIVKGSTGQDKHHTLWKNIPIYFENGMVLSLDLNTKENLSDKEPCKIEAQVTFTLPLLGDKYANEQKIKEMLAEFTQDLHVLDGKVSTMLRRKNVTVRKKVLFKLQQDESQRQYSIAPENHSQLLQATATDLRAANIYEAANRGCIIISQDTYIQKIQNNIPRSADDFENEVFMRNYGRAIEDLMDAQTPKQQNQTPDAITIDLSKQENQEQKFLILSLLRLSPLALINAGNCETTGVLDEKTTKLLDSLISTFEKISKLSNEVQLTQTQSSLLDNPDTTWTANTPPQTPIKVGSAEFNALTPNTKCQVTMNALQAADKALIQKKQELSQVRASSGTTNQTATEIATTYQPGYACAPGFFNTLFAGCTRNSGDSEENYQRADSMTK